MPNSPKERIKEITEKLLELLSVPGEILVEEKEGSVFVQITDTEPGILIGYRGETLKALQYIIRLMSFSEFREDAPTIIVDVEDYRKNEEEKLKVYVQKLAELVKNTGREEALHPMSSYKRRLIHMFVSEIDGVKSESRGEGTERRIVISPE